MIDTIAKIMVVVGMIGVPIALFLFARMCMLYYKTPKFMRVGRYNIIGAATLAPVILFLIHTRLWTALLLWAGIFIAVDITKRAAKQL